MNIPRWPFSDAREEELIRQVLASDRWGGFHEFVGRFEQSFAAFQHCRHSVSAFNGTVTLEMALQAMEIGPGDEVIVPAISFISTATAVSRVGAIPVFVDIEPYSFLMDSEAATRAITPRTRAIMAVHFGGPMVNMDHLAALGVPLIEDAAHSHGSEWNGRRAGSFGVCGSFSFQNSKVMTAGEGGILTSNDEDFIDRVRAIANQGRRKNGGWFEHYTLGTNYRLTAFQAAVLIAQLERLPEQNCRREQNARIVRQALQNAPGLTLQQIEPQAHIHTNYLLLGRLETGRDAFHKAMIQAGIPCTPFYPHTLYNNPLYRSGGCRVHPCPNAEACIQDAFWLPHRVLLGSADQAREIAAVMGKIAATCRTTA